MDKLKQALPLYNKHQLVGPIFVLISLVTTLGTVIPLAILAKKNEMSHGLAMGFFLLVLVGVITVFFLVYAKFEQRYKPLVESWAHEYGIKPDSFNYSSIAALKEGKSYEFFQSSGNESIAFRVTKLGDEFILSKAVQIFEPVSVPVNPERPVIYQESVNDELWKSAR